jgi:hypothetical protein
MWNWKLYSRDRAAICLWDLMPYTCRRSHRKITPSDSKVPSWAMVGTPVLHSEGPGFKSQAEYRPSWHVFRVVSLSLEANVDVLHSSNSRSHPSRFIIHTIIHNLRSIIKYSIRSVFKVWFRKICLTDRIMEASRNIDLFTGGKESCVLWLPIVKDLGHCFVMMTEWRLRYLTMMVQLEGSYNVEWGEKIIMTGEYIKIRKKVVVYHI